MLLVMMALKVFFTVGDETPQAYLFDLTKKSVINDNDENSDDSSGMLSWLLLCVVYSVTIITMLLTTAVNNFDYRWET